LLGLKSLRGRVNPGPDAALLQSMVDITESLGRELHDLAVELRPTALDDLGLIRTLENTVQEWAARTHVATELHIRGFEGERLSPQVETTLYRIVREALTNVVKHAQAKHTSVLVERHPEHVTAIVEDDGVGFDPQQDLAKKGRRLGLLGMQERAALVGGQLTVESSAGAGTTIFVRVPLSDSDTPL
jgi:signal transduction histidine kinase